MGELLSQRQEKKRGAEHEEGMVTLLEIVPGLNVIAMRRKVIWPEIVTIRERTEIGHSRCYGCRRMAMREKLSKKKVILGRRKPQSKD